MDYALLTAAVAVFACGFTVGYLIRDGISRRRRAKANRHRTFFYEGRLAAHNSYIENLSARDKTANTETVNSEVDATSGSEGTVTLAPR